MKITRDMTIRRSVQVMSENNDGCVTVRIEERRSTEEGEDRIAPDEIGVVFRRGAGPMTLNNSEHFVISREQWPMIREVIQQAIEEWDRAAASPDFSVIPALSNEPPENCTHHR